MSEIPNSQSPSPAGVNVANSPSENPLENSFVNAYEDFEVLDWLLGIVNDNPNPAGDFLNSVADAAFRADFEDYPVMRPFLLQMMARYPKYAAPGPIFPSEKGGAR